MAKQVVNTDKIAASASRLRVINNNINRSFGDLQKKVKELDAKWKGRAGETAQTSMYQLLKNSEERSKVIQNYINLMEQQVNPGYNSTETANKKLADNFK